MKHEKIFKIQEILQDSNDITGFTLIRVMMDLYDGNLLNFIQTFETNEKLIVQFGIQILNGLKYLHSKDEKKFNQKLKDLVINLLSPVLQERMNVDEILEKLKELK
jgi:serine/threonine protein kinase